MPDHDKSIEEADLWDILDWATVEALAAEAPDDPRENSGREVLAFMAKALIEAGSKDGTEDEKVLHRIATPFIGNGVPAVRRQKAGRLAAALGAKPERFVEYLAYKWALFKL